MRLFCFLFGFALTLSSEIIETPHFREIVTYASPETLIILDIDDTLLTPCQMLGTNAWFEYRFKENRLRAKCGDDPLDQTLAYWEGIRHFTQMEIVEEGSDKIIDSLQNQGIPVMGLTTQGLALATRTINQLYSCGIDLSKTSPTREDCYFDNGHGVLFRKGILFTSGTHKGAALLKYLEIANIRPSRVVFLNDYKSHLLQVEESLEKKGISFIGLRYGFSDERVRRFSPEIADIQLRYSSFERILSDAEAEKIMSELVTSSLNE